MNKSKKIILFGDREFAEIAYEYFTYDSVYEVVAFTVEKAFLSKNTLCGLPIIPFEEITSLYPPSEVNLYIAIVYDKLNRTREKFFNAGKEKGYTLASYVSSRSFLWHNV